jgi:hypothetical protein
MIKIFSEEINNCDANIFGEWINNLEQIRNTFINAKPFEHVIIHNFLKDDIANQVYNDFPTNYNDWHSYWNPLEVKYANDNFETLPQSIKNIFLALSTEKLCKVFSFITNKNLEYDPYLHGGGLHAHPRFGRLALHLDYEKHPFLNKQRSCNIILYLNKIWKQEWNGQTELWDADVSNCIIKSYPVFNSIILFKTNEISWHGLPEKILCPENIYRQSLAYYYISNLENNNYTNKFGAAEDGYRYKASFIKRPNDPNDERIDKLFKIRPIRRITEEDMKEIWEDWTPESN